MTDGGHNGKSQHDERDVAVPAMPRSGFVMIKTKFVLGSLEAVFNGPTTAFNLDQCLNRSSCGAPCGEVGVVK